MRTYMGKWKVTFHDYFFRGSLITIINTIEKLQQCNLVNCVFNPQSIFNIFQVNKVSLYDFSLAYALIKQKKFTRTQNVISELLLKSFHSSRVQSGETWLWSILRMKPYFLIIIHTFFWLIDDTLFVMHYRNCYLLTGFYVDIFLCRVIFNWKSMLEFTFVMSFYWNVKWFVEF